MPIFKAITLVLLIREIARENHYLFSISNLNRCLSTQMCLMYNAGDGRQTFWSVKINKYLQIKSVKNFV